MATLKESYKFYYCLYWWIWAGFCLLSFNMSLLIWPCFLISHCSIRNSVSDVDLFLFDSTCGISPRRPRTLLPHSPSPPRALSPSGTGKLKFLFIAYVMFCAIWYYLYNLKNMKNTQEGVLLLVKLQAKSVLEGVLLLVACNFTKGDTPPWVFFTFFKLRKSYQIVQRITYIQIRLFIPQI